MRTPVCLGRTISSPLRCCCCVAGSCAELSRPIDLGVLQALWTLRSIAKGGGGGNGNGSSSGGGEAWMAVGDGLASRVKGLLSLRACELLVALAE